eukprot:CAMPEP_0113847722 /NCGR_PEP_ID=MMETSP0372-20130328/2040_1 /TAXON_ID=340204 /ORGANISM="Lankesteria abbotti" /LENGTH=88 /DNA_ID=CAMNT_0000817047 /DNA_START=48 /DNA_END=314 /DNA_ORIENTATION=- /assembly_acc=CAM_ASM_000359
MSSQNDEAPVNSFTNPGAALQKMLSRGQGVDYRGSDEMVKVPANLDEEGSFDRQEGGPEEGFLEKEKKKHDKKHESDKKEKVRSSPKA